MWLKTYGLNSCENLPGLACKWFHIFLLKQDYLSQGLSKWALAFRKWNRLRFTKQYYWLRGKMPCTLELNFAENIFLTNAKLSLAQNETITLKTNFGRHG